MQASSRKSHTKGLSPFVFHTYSHSLYLFLSHIPPLLSHIPPLFLALHPIKIAKLTYNVSEMDLL